MKQLNTLLLAMVCLSPSLVTATLAPSKVCFDQGCTPVVAKANLVDPKGEFVYPDPNRFPTSSQRSYYRKPIAFMDLQTTNAKLRLSKDFYLDDFAAASKGRYALVSPSMVKRLQNMRDSLGAGLRITSGYRSPAYNRRIDGSATWSRHTYGDAVDLVGKPLKSIRNACTANKATFFLLYSDGHIHCDWRAIPLDPAFYPPAGKAAPNALLFQNQIALSQATQIQFEQTESGTQMTVKMPEMELEGVPAYKWVVTSPSGKETLFDAPAPILKLDEKGTYFVKVIVGDFIESESNLENP